MVSETLYIPIVFSLTIVYTVTFGFCMYRTNKFNYFNDEWRHTKIFYISVISQLFIRMTTYSLLTFAITESERTLDWITVMRSIPDTLFFVNYFLLGYQTMNIFYHSHMENNIHVFVLMQFIRPKFSKAKKIIALLILFWIGFMCFMYLMFLSKFLTSSDIDTEFTIVNLLSGTFVLVFLMFLYSKYSETPFKSQQHRLNLQICSKILLIWTLGRYFKGFLGLLSLKSALLLSYLSNPQSSTIGGALTFIGQSIISEVICFIYVMDYRFINIFISQEAENIKKSDAESQDTTSRNNSENPLIRTAEAFIDSKALQLTKQIRHRLPLFGEIFEGNFEKDEVFCRKIKIDNSETESFKKEIQELKAMNFPKLNYFYGAVVNVSEIILIYAKENNSLYKFIHEDKTILSLKEKIELAQDIAFCVHSLHEKKIFHGHLSSQNIFLTQGYKPIIADVGLIKLRRMVANSKNYSNKSQWSSPEIMKSKEKIASRPIEADDIYSLGVIIWEIITGDIPFSHFENENYQEEVIKNAATPYVPRYFPGDLIKLFQECWAPLESRTTAQAIFIKLSNLQLTP